MKPDFSGNWRLLLDKSKLAGSQPARAVVRIEHHDPRLVDIGLFTYADGSTVTLTSPAAQTASGNATSSYNFIERMIAREAQAISSGATNSLALNV